MKSSKLILFLLLSVATPVLCMDGFEAPLIHDQAPVEDGGEGEGEQGQPGEDGQDGNEETENDYGRIDSQRSGSGGRSRWNPFSWGRGKTSGGAATDGFTGQGDGSGITEGGATAASETSVTADVTRGLRVRTDKLTGDILTDKDGNIQFEQKKPTVSTREWWGDVWDRHFSRGRERQEVSALTDKMQELKQELQNTNNSEKHEKLLSQLTQVQDRLGRKALDLERDWGRWKKRSDLQEAQRSDNGGSYGIRFNDARQQARVNLLTENPTTKLMQNSSEGNLKDALNKLDQSVAALDADGQKSIINEKITALKDEITKRSVVEGPREDDSGDGLMKMAGDNDTRSGFKKFGDGFIGGVTGSADGAQSLAMYQTGILDAFGEDATRVQLLAENPTESRIESASFTNLVEAVKVLERREKVAPLRTDAIKSLRSAQQKRIESLLTQDLMEKTPKQLKEEARKLRDIKTVYGDSPPDWYSESEEGGVSLKNRVDRLLSKVENLSVAKSRDTEMLRMNFDRELKIYQDSRPGSSEEETARRTLEDYQQELESRYAENPRNAFDTINNVEIERNRNILASEAYKNKTLKLNSFGRPIEERQPLSSPTNAMDYESQGPVSGPNPEPQELIDAREAAEKQRLAEERRATNTEIDRIMAQVKANQPPVLDIVRANQSRYNLRRVGPDGRTPRERQQQEKEARARNPFVGADFEGYQARVDDPNYGGDGTREGLERWRETVKESRLAQKQRDAEEEVPDEDDGNDGDSLRTESGSSDRDPTVLSGEQSANGQPLDPDEKVSPQQMTNELNVDPPTSAQQRAYDRAYKKMSRYAAERSNRRGRSRDFKAFENKYFGPLTEPQKLLLRTEFDRFAQVGKNAGRQFREDREERKLDTTTGAIKGLINIGK